MTAAPAEDDLFSLNGRVALITGAAGYLGSAMAEALAEKGAHVILNGRTGKPLEVLARRLSGRGLSASVEAFDVTDTAAVLSAVKGIRKQHSRVHVLVNNAYAPKGGTMESARPKHFADAYAFVTSAFFLAQQIKPMLVAGAKDTNGGASIINVASMYGLVSPDKRVYLNQKDINPPFYGPSKAALLQLTRYMACQWALKGIRANAISPGPFPDPHNRGNTAKFKQRLADRTPLGRIGEADEIRGPIVFLASDASSYVTGANLSVDGGWTAW
jgi:NAD(P)-dependent dehydrogenase (short-subunit alcohol dehydrogenase family)